LPPLTPFTDQVTAAFEVPATAAVNACAPPARTLADAGLTVTVTVAGGGVVPPPPLPGFCVPAQPSWITRSPSKLLSRKK
jgi:hypothetical protein